MIRALALALVLAGCGMPAPTFTMPRDDGPLYASGSGHRAEAAIARRREAQDRAAERGVGEIGFAVLRGGDVAGDHRVVFAGQGERIELAHLASDRRIYSLGAVRAAIWAGAQPPGLYGMSEVLGLRAQSAG